MIVDIVSSKKNLGANIACAGCRQAPDVLPDRGEGSRRGEGQVFASPKDAEGAALRHIGGTRKLPKTPRGDDVALQWSS